jgi:hypothetical protein
MPQTQPVASLPALGDGIIEFFGGILVDHHFHHAR